MPRKPLSVGRWERTQNDAQMVTMNYFWVGDGD